MSNRGIGSSALIFATFIIALILSPAFVFAEEAAEAEESDENTVIPEDYRAAEEKDTDGVITPDAVTETTEPETSDPESTYPESTTEPEPPAATVELLEPAPKKPHPKIGPFVIASEDGESSLRIRFGGQIRFEYLRKDNGEDIDPDDKFSIGFVRLRPRITGTALSKKVSYSLYTEINPGKMQLLDLFVNYAPISDFQVRVGQFKVPFTRHHMMSFGTLGTTDYALTNKYYAADRQIGLMLHNGYNKGGEIEYNLGAFWGESAQSSSPAMAALFGEKYENQSSLVNPGPRGDMHPEIFFRFVYNYNHIDVGRDADIDDGPPRFSLGLSVAWDINPVRVYEQALQVAPEFVFKASGFSLLLTYYYGLVEEADPDDYAVGKAFTYEPGSMGYTGQIGYFFADMVELTARYASARYEDKLARQAYDRARSLVAVAGPDSPEEAQYSKAGIYKGKQEAMLALSVHFIGESLKWTNEGGAEIETIHGQKDRMHFKGRSQILLAF